MNTDEHRWRNARRRLVGLIQTPSLRAHLRPSGATGVLCALCFVSSCNSIPTGLADKPVGAYDRPYPRQLAQGEVLDIQVIRSPETVLTMTNTTARTFGPSTVWINGRYSRPILGMAPGETLRLDLYEFRDEFGEKFRAGGFFATKKPDQVVHAQLETIENGETKMIGLVVVGQDE
ncbi:MAG TPA: hypothetical protein VFF69_08575 [Phycisphaerales bacterium]|nr:hypothetical protein [Phycisphaerales bacterium]